MEGPEQFDSRHTSRFSRYLLACVAAGIILATVAKE